MNQFKDEKALRQNTNPQISVQQILKVSALPCDLSLEKVDQIENQALNYVFSDSQQEEVLSRLQRLSRLQKLQNKNQSTIKNIQNYLNRPTPTWLIVSRCISLTIILVCFVVGFYSKYSQKKE